MRPLLSHPPLAFPAGRRPGFNQNHLALNRLGCRYSCVAERGNIVNLLTGKQGVMTGSFVNKMLGSVGPSIFADSNNEATISGLSTLNPTNGTVAVIFSHDGNAAGNKGLNNGQVVPLYNNAFKVFWANSSNVLDTGIILSANRFYFAIASWISNATLTGFVVDLTNGVTVYSTQSIVGNSTVAEGSTDVIPFGNAGTTVGYTLAAIAYTYKYMNEKELRKWGQDPWGFWYPPQ